jgi:hypothetical protein
VISAEHVVIEFLKVLFGLEFIAVFVRGVFVFE